jgi:hypothetical protein
MLSVSPQACESVKVVRKFRKATLPLSRRLIPLYFPLNVLSLTNLTKISCNQKQPNFSRSFNDLTSHPRPDFFDTLLK